MLDLTLADYTNIGIGIAVGYMAFQNRRDQIKAEAARVKNEAAILAAKLAVEEAAKKAVEAVEAQKMEAALVAERVKLDLIKSTEVNDKKLDTIHNLVNSDMGKVLAKNAAAMDKIAILENTKENIAASKEARMLLEAHEAKQHQVDAKDDSGFETSPI